MWLEEAQKEIIHLLNIGTREKLQKFLKAKNFIVYRPRERDDYKFKL